MITLQHLIQLLASVFSVVFIAYAILIAYYRRAWIQIPFFSAGSAGSTAVTADVPALSADHRTSISVLVPARNEARNIAACVSSLARQSFPRNRYEIIVIDDHSTDGTGDIVRALDFPGLTLRCLPLADVADSAETRAYKKRAIETGIAAAAGELIVTTDADCRFDPDWLATLAAFYKEKDARFIAAPVRIVGRPSFLTAFQTLDFITLQGITGASVYKKFHSMCNGANLAYPKKTFYETGGFKGIDSIPSGDDMLLMHKIYGKYPDKVFFLKSAAAVVSTGAEESWKGLINQRVRWASKADRYDDRRIFNVLLLVYVLNVFFLAVAVAACWNRVFLWVLIVGLIVKTAVEYPFVATVARFFKQDALLPWFPFLQPFHILYTVVIGWMGKFGSYRWKDRKITK